MISQPKYDIKSSVSEEIGAINPSKHQRTVP